MSVKRMKNTCRSVGMLLVTVIAVFMFVSCNKNKNKRCNTVISDYLYGVEYDDYDFDSCRMYFDKQYNPSGACSEVRRGDYVGRNLDWYINRNASAIIKMNHTDDHYASIGMVSCFSSFTNDIAKSGEYNDVYKYLPLKTLDGINECGLYVGENVMPTGETSFDSTTWEPHKYGHGASHTHPGASLTCVVTYLTRILLDKASSVEDAMRIIDEIDWVEPVNYPHKGETQSFHWLICDAHRSVILEFMDNKAHYVEASSITEPGYGTIMTNFTNSLMESGMMQINGIGYERYDILHDNYKNYDAYPDNFEGMQNLMKQVWFSNTYTIPIDSKDIWLTEFASDNLPASFLYHNYDILLDPDLYSALQQEVNGFKNKMGWFTDECAYWFSTYTAVYNLTSLKFRVLAHEGRSGMKSYYEASFSSHFAKPLEQ